MQKVYKPSDQPSEKQTKKAVKYEIKEKELREKFGEKLRYIVFHADKAVRTLAIKDKHRAKKVKLHTDQAEQWAVDLGVCSTDEIEIKLKRKGKIRHAEHIRKRPGAIEKLEDYLNQRVDNTRSHVVQIIHQDTFLEENLVRIEEMLVDSKNTANAQTMMESELRIAASVRKLINEEMKSAKQNGTIFEPTINLSEIRLQFKKLEGMTIPYPRKGASEEELKELSIKHLARIKLSTKLMLAFFMLSTEEKQEVSGILKESYSKGIEGMRYLLEYFKDDESNKTVKLEDAWNKVIEYIPPKSKDRGSPNKRQKTTISSLYTKTRVLFAPGHKTPSNIIHELESRNATLLSGENDIGNRVLVKVGNAFELKIFFSPLLVTIRATNRRAQEASGINDEGNSNFRHLVMYSQLPSWRSASDCLHEGLELDREDLLTNPAIIQMTAKKLSMASAKATWVLRKCFSDIDSFATQNEFEIALAEGSALLHFLRLVKDRYTPEIETGDT